MKKSYYSLGLMSGTSMDGVDASIIQSDGEKKYKVILDKYFNYTKDIYQDLLKVTGKIAKYRNPRSNKILLNTLSNDFRQLEKKITLFHIKLVNKIIKDSKVSIDLIGFHGQTIFHNPKEKKSIQLGNGKELSKLTQKTVVYNFREKDIKNGGEGAPLTPIFHLLLARKFKIRLPVTILNIGGIANVTCIKNNKKENKVFALDIGPGNCLLDQWMRKKSKKRYDKNGKIAQTGKINQVILKKAFNNWVEEFKKKSSKKVIFFLKSHDISDYNHNFVNKLSLKDGAATLTEYTAQIYAYFINKIVSQKNLATYYPKEIIVCGGGRKNKSLMKSLNKKISCGLSKIDRFGINGDFVESQAFAYLAIRSYLKLPISFPKTTNVHKPISGGDVINF